MTRTKRLIIQILRAWIGQDSSLDSEPEPEPQWFGEPAARVLATIPGNSLARDSHYWAADADTCMTWLIEFHSQMPPYRSITSKHPGYDCDKAAHDCVSHFYRKGWNRIWEVWGDTPNGFHAWNVIDNALGRFEAEPQAARVWADGTNPKYRRRLWVVPQPDGTNAYVAEEGFQDADVNVG